MINLLTKGEPKVAIIGPTTSTGLVTTGQISPIFNVVQLSCQALTASTKDKTLYPTVIKVNQDSDLLNPLRIKIMETFGWNRIGAIVYQHEIYSPEMNEFFSLLDQNNMTLVTSASFSSTSSFRAIIQTLKQFDVRIVMLAIAREHGAALFCEIYRQNMYGSSYVWILSGSLLFSGFQYRGESNCTRAEIDEALDGYFSLHNLYMGSSTKHTISGQTAEEVSSMFQEEIRGTAMFMPPSWTFMPDSAWALAIGLNNSLGDLTKRNLSLHDYTYSKEFLEAIMDGILTADFEAISGPLAFDECYQRIGLTYFMRNYLNTGKGHVTVKVADYDVTTNTLDWYISKETVWPDGRIPKDRFIYRSQVVSADRLSVGLVMTVGLCGAAMSLTFTVLNIYFRNNRLIKMSSPQLNHVIIAGCITMYVEVMVHSTFELTGRSSEKGGYYCMVRVWVLSLGFTLLFGALFAKTYRVYVVFRGNIKRSKIIRDRHLFAIIGVMVLADVLFLLLWSTLSPLQTNSIRVLQIDDDPDIVLYLEYLYCDHSLKKHWFFAIYVYKGLLLVFGVFLAVQTRNVTVEELNDSRYIGACIYNVVVICMFGVPLVHLLPIEQHVLSYILESLLVIVGTTLSQCIIFIPKFHARNKVHGRRFLASNVLTSTSDHRTKHATKDSSGPTHAVTHTAEHQDDGKHQLEMEIKNLQLQIDKEARAIEKLRNGLFNLTGDVYFYKSGDEYVLARRSNMQESLRM